MDATAPKVLRFSTSDFAPEKRLAAYREIYGSTIVRHDITPIGEQPFRFEATFCNLPGLGLMTSLISPCRRWHGPQHVNGDDFVLGVGLGGDRCIVQQCGRDATLGEGRAVLTNCAEPALVVLPGVARPLSMRIPRAVLASRVAGLDDRTSQMIPPSSALKLLTSYVAAMWDSGMTTMEPRLRDIVVTHVHDLAALVLGADGDARELAEQRGARAARLRAILQAIKTGSANPRLSASAVAAALAVTPRYVHLLLEETGKSFTHHVLERRLDNAADLLRDPQWRDHRITDIAAAVGFSDLSYFNRTFRRRFGMAPSDVRVGGPADRPG
jgi:AraC-like DNA-binding protein